MTHPHTHTQKRGREREYFCFNLLKKNVANGKSTSMPSYIAWKNMNQTYSLRPAKTICLAFKFCPTKTVRLDCSKVHLIKAISNTKKKLYEPIKCLSRSVNVTFLIPMHLHREPNEQRGFQSQLL